MNFLKSTLVISSCTLLSRIFGFLRDICFAKYLGTGYIADIFLTAFKLPNFFRNIFTEGALNSSFVPIFSNKIENSSREESNKFARNIFSIILYSVLIMTILSEIFMPILVNLLAPGFNSENYTLIIPLSRITIIYLIFISSTSFLSAILNSYNKFASVSITPIILNITLIFFSILSSHFSINITYILSYALVIGGILQFMWLFFFTIKNKVILYPVLPKLDNNIKKFFKNFFNGFLSYGVIQINSMIDAIIATSITGAVSFIYYSDRISQLPLSLIGTAIGTTILPILSKNINNEKSEKIKQKSIFIGLFFGIPCSIGLFALSEIFIPILFERGEFTNKDSLAVISCLKIYAFSLPIFIINKILQVIFYSYKDMKTPVLSSIINLFFNFILNLIFIKYIGYKGIVLSTVISSYINSTIMIIILKNRKWINIDLEFIIKFLKLIYPILFMTLTIIFLKSIIPESEVFILRLLKLSIISIISAIMYIGLSIILKIIDRRFIFEEIN